MLNVSENAPNTEKAVKLSDAEALKHSQTKQLKKRSRLDLTTRRNLMGYWFILPFVLGLAFIYIPALIRSFRFSMSDIHTVDSGYVLENVGWANYRDAVVVDPDFVRGIWESMGTMLLNVVIILIYALIMATVLNRNIAGKGLYRAILFLPVVAATGVIATAESFAVTTDHVANIEAGAAASAGGVFSEFDIALLLESLNISDTLTNIVTSAISNLYNIVSRSGVQLIIFLAGLQSISPAIYESATVEGATWWEGFWKITIPMISPLILVNMVYTIVDSFTQHGNKVMDEIYDLIGNGSFEEASARSFLYLAVVAFILLIVVPLVNKFVFYENK